MSTMSRWIRYSLLIACMSVVTLAPVSIAEAALSANLKLKGQKQGDIKGGVTKKGRENSIEVLAYSHEIVSPRDAASGLPTGKRQHKPFVITKELDKSSPLLHSVLVNNENLADWRLDIYQPSAKGQEAVAYTIRLTNARITSIETVTDDDGHVREVVSFTYQKIEWVWTDGGITAQDDWETSKR